MCTVGCINFLRWKSSARICFPRVSGGPKIFFFFLPQKPSSASHLRVPTIPLYKNQRRPIRIVVALSEPNFVFDGLF